ncbi:unnamed protein product [Menidia menidia]|uniref:(Atlantic silverside) hypothetical protein n=1 Tax=Menidia menidia TaxID=238744 RepID=A0A8S4A6R0_9TELE|nr:unnamed protein product [Menidia menidia]
MVSGCLLVRPEKSSGHEEEDVRLRVADIAKRPNVAHHVQGASLVDQAGVQSQHQIGHQQSDGSRPTPRFEMGQRGSCVIFRGSPVYAYGPDHCHQEDFVSSEGESASVKKEREMRADHNSEALREVPVPGVRAVEIGHAVEDVELEEVELHQSPLKRREEQLHPTPTAGAGGSRPENEREKTSFDGDDPEYKPDRNVVVSDESQFAFILPEMVNQQRKPEDQGRGSNDHSQSHQSQRSDQEEEFCICKRSQERLDDSRKPDLQEGFTSSSLLPNFSRDRRLSIRPQHTSPVGVCEPGESRLIRRLTDEGPASGWSTQTNSVSCPLAAAAGRLSVYQAVFTRCISPKAATHFLLEEQCSEQLFFRTQTHFRCPFSRLQSIVTATGSQSSASRWPPLGGAVRMRAAAPDTQQKKKNALLPYITVLVVVSEVMFQRRLPFTQLAMATLLGVIGGMYIYRPYFETVPKTPGQQNPDVPKKQKETD